MKLDALKPPRISNAVRAALADVKIEPTADEPALAQDWGEEGLSPAERLFAWNTLEVLAMSSGNIDKPANAIPGRANAVLQLRFVVGTKYEEVIDAVRTHLHANGFPMVEVSGAQRFAASRTDVDSPWVNWTANSIRQTTGKAPAILPNFGGSLPNDVFSEGLGSAHDLGAAFLSRLLAACAGRTHFAAGHGGGAGHHGGPVLGPRRDAARAIAGNGGSCDGIFVVMKSEIRRFGE